MSRTWCNASSALLRSAGTHKGKDDYVCGLDAGSATRHAATGARCAASGERRPQSLGGSVFLVLAMLDQIVDHGGIGERRGVAETSRFVLGDLTQDTAHDLAGAGLRQPRRELDLIGRRDRPDVL